MKIINCPKLENVYLEYIHPEKKISPYIALIPASEYFFWHRRFTHLVDALSSFIYPTKLNINIPIIQCVSKFIGINQDGFLLPKVFKFGTLPEGTFKNFGLSNYMVPLLDVIANELNYPIRPFPINEFKNDYLGFFAFDSKHNPFNGYEKYLSRFMPCISINRLKDVSVYGNKLWYLNREYSAFLPTYNYYENEYFQAFLKKIHELQLLLLPLDFQLNNLQKLIGFTDPAWAEVKPLESFLDESPDHLNQYVLIRTDDGKILSWNDIIITPKFRLEIEMSDYWLWQEACPTNSMLENLNLYWEFGMEYPWIIDKRDNTLIPAFVVDD